MVDERDFWIVSQLRKDPFTSFETLGRGAGLSGNAVKARIEALEKGKIVSSLQGLPAAQVFHRFPRLFFFEMPSPVMLDDILEIDSAVFATQDVDRKVGVLAYNLSNAAKPPEELVDLLGPIEFDVTPLLPYPQKELSKPVTIAELRVLRMLVSNLRVPIKEIAESTGLSQKTSKKIRRQLLEDGLLQVQPIFQTAQSYGIIMYELHVHSGDNSVLFRIRQSLPKSIFLNQWDPSAMIFSCWADSLAEVFETQKKLRSEPSVSRVLVKFHTQAILSTSRLSTWIDEEILRLESNKTKA